MVADIIKIQRNPRKNMLFQLLQFHSANYGNKSVFSQQTDVCPASHYTKKLQKLKKISSVTVHVNVGVAVIYLQLVRY